MLNMVCLNMACQIQDNGNRSIRSGVGSGEYNV
jgi:hypothetical protein